MDQYADEIVGITNLARAVDRDSPRRVQRRFDLRHNSSIYLLSNSYLAHNPKWKTLVEQVMQRPLESMDAIALGVFNSCRTDINTMYASEMLKQAVIDCLQQEGPTMPMWQTRIGGPSPWFPCLPCSI